MKPKDLSTVVVVGAAGGIGKQIAMQLRGHAQVLAVVQNAAQREEVEDLCMHSIECNLSCAESVQDTIASIDSHCTDGIRGLIFCAAMQPVGPLELISRNELEKVFAVNVFGTLQLAQGLIPKLRQRRGRMVLFSSMAGKVATPMLGAYASSKFALEGAADAWRRELRLSNISLSIIEPGGVDTPMAAAQGDLVQRTLERLDVQSEQRYGRLVRGYRALAQAGMKHASTPAAVARVAVDAVISASEPKARYIVGNDAKLLILISRLMPTRWFDGLLMKMTLEK